MADPETFYFKSLLQKWFSIGLAGPILYHFLYTRDTHIWYGYVLSYILMLLIVMVIARLWSDYLKNTKGMGFFNYYNPYRKTLTNIMY